MRGVDPARANKQPPRLLDGALSVVTRIPAAAVQPGLSPRLLGSDVNHVRGLAEVADLLPPIVVHRTTMKIIDGEHRWQVAVALGHKDIDVRYFDGSEEDAFLLGIALNLQHGLPLGLEDRKAAAGRILAMHKEWSDRKIAEATGLSPKTVASIRDGLRHPTEEIPQLTSRVGRDNRRRRVPSSDKASSAKARSENNPPSGSVAALPMPPIPSPRLRLERRSRTRSSETKEPSRNETVDLAPATTMLREDPSIRLSDPGRDLLRLLSSSNITQERWRRIADVVPPYRRHLVADLAEQCSSRWRTLAGMLRDKAEQDNQD